MDQFERVNWEDRRRLNMHLKGCAGPHAYDVAGRGAVNEKAQEWSSTHERASLRQVAISAAGSPFGFGICGSTTTPPCSWQRSAHSERVASRLPPNSASSAP